MMLRRDRQARPAGHPGRIPARPFWEVLDPEQKQHVSRQLPSAFPFDLSRRGVHHHPRNVLDTISGDRLRDRMENHKRLPAILAAEKSFRSHGRYLVRRQLEANGIYNKTWPGRDFRTMRSATIYWALYPRKPEYAISERERSEKPCVTPAGPSCGRREWTNSYREGRSRRGFSVRPAVRESELAMRTSVPGVATGSRVDAGRPATFCSSKQTRIPGQRQVDPHRTSSGEG